MISVPTVFILGAGASAPYGFPLGPNLKAKILERLRNDAIRQTVYIDYKDDVIDPFIELLTISPYDTIDAIISRKLSISEIGKKAISDALYSCQKHEAVLSKKDWYQHFFVRSEFDSAAYLMPEITFVTFNYDNSLEYFFEKTIETHYDEPFQQVLLQRYNSMKFIHLHGRLASFPPKDTPYDLLMEARQKSDIRIISDADLDDAPQFKEAHSALSRAKRVVFLGFGYDSINLKRLRINEWDSSIETLATCAYMDPEKVKPKLPEKTVLLPTTCLEAFKAWPHIFS